MKENFTKDDLRTGMLCITKDGWGYMFIKDAPVNFEERIDCLFNLRSGVRIGIEDYNIDLIHIYCPSNTIVKIYEIDYFGDIIGNISHIYELLNPINASNFLIWERKEKEDNAIILSDGTQVSESTIKMLLKKEYGD